MQEKEKGSNCLQSFWGYFTMIWTFNIFLLRTVWVLTGCWWCGNWFSVSSSGHHWQLRLIQEWSEDTGLVTHMLPPNIYQLFTLRMGATHHQGTTINNQWGSHNSVFYFEQKVWVFGWTFKDFMKATVMFLFIYKEKRENLFIKKDICESKYFFFMESLASSLD